MSMRKRPTLSEQGRRLSELQQRIGTILDDAETQIRSEPKRAGAMRRRARAEAAPLIAEGAALRDAIVARARRRAKLAWTVVYAGCALIAILLAAWLLL
jgi:hypothetical protein